MESCSVKITIGNKSLYVFGIYRPPDKAKLHQFDLLLIDVLSRFDAIDCVFLIGDLNLDTICPSNNEVNSVNYLISHSLVPFINLPTRVTSSTDNIYFSR